MDEQITAYPLAWPIGRPRTDRWHREKANFETTFARARDDIIREVALLKGTRVQYLGRGDVIISTNTALRQDGLPLAAQRNPDDPGVAVYFKYRDKPMSFACDRWTKIEDNMRAIVKTIEALRGVARWGTGDMLEAAFTGFTALPPPGGNTDWRAVLGVANTTQTEESLREYYRRAAMQAHPDRGGTADRMSAVNNAYEQAKRSLGFT